MLLPLHLLLRRPRLPRHPALARLRLVALVAWGALASGVLSTAPAMAAPAAVSSAPVLPGQRLAVYAGRAAALRQQALAHGAVNYLDVLEAAYGPGAIGPDVLAAKERWRARAGPGLTYVTDYSQLLDTATVGVLQPVANPVLRSTLVAQYESLSHRISISAAASDCAIFHEAGHTLQRATLRVRGTADSRRPDLPEALLARESQSSALDATTLRRLEYLCSQAELEVRLQDLNRFHALLSDGTPIMEPADALHALLALGLTISYEEAREVFALAGEGLTADQFTSADYRFSPQEAERVASLFEDARELRIIRRLALRLDPACWTPLLSKILFEAPGHL